MSEEIKLAELTDKCRNMFIQKAFVAKLKAEKTVEEKKLTEMQDEIIMHLEEHDLKNFDTGFGKVSRSNTPYAKIEDKIALTAFLKKRGIFEDMATLNAAKMNTYFNEEMAIAKKEMNLDFKIDGMEVSSNRVKLSVTGVKI